MPWSTRMRSFRPRRLGIKWQGQGKRTLDPSWLFLGFCSSSHYVDNIFVFFFQDSWGRPCTTWCYSTLSLFDGELRYTTTLSLKVLIQVGCVCNRVRPRRPSTRRPHFRFVRIRTKTTTYVYRTDVVGRLFSLLLPLHYIFGSYFRETFEKWRHSIFLRKSTFNAKFV